MKMLENLRNFYISEKKKGKKHKAIIAKMSTDIFEGGIIYYDVNYYAAQGTTAIVSGSGAVSGATAASNAASAMPLILGSVLYTAQMGLNYRKLKKGRMTEE